MENLFTLQIKRVNIDHAGLLGSPGFAVLSTRGHLFGDEERLFCLSADRQVYKGRYIFSCSFDTCWRPLLLCARCLKHLLSARCCVRAGPALKKQLFVFVYVTFLWTYHILKKIKEKI